MGVVITPYTYTDGNVLAPTQHDSNIFSATGDQGIMSEPNGGLDTNNMAGGFQVQPEHVQPGEVVRAYQEQALDSVDYTSDSFSESGDASNAYVGLAGCSVRVFLPYTAAIVLWQWTVFAHCFRFRDGASGAGTNAAIRMRASVDGSAVPSTRRLFPETWYDDNAGGARLYGRETRAAYSRDLAHLSRNLAAGWHELDVRLYMDLVDITESIARDFTATSITTDHYMHHRLTAGIRNARALVLL